MVIQETTFGPKQYLTLRKAISTSQVSDQEMYKQAGKKLHEYAQKNNITLLGGWCVLYFTWDQENKKTEIGISMPVEGVTSVNDPELSLIDIPVTKAVMTVMKGAYDKLGDIHHAMNDYVSEHKLNVDLANLPLMAIEDYIVSPMTEANPENFVTNIYYLHN